ncbi:PaaI family thioesterase [Christensenella timonensis]|uniref:PaaI family thioesterase n=1 Tax=Christensenella timonensis TaxID=1816678 RepID=UPI0009ECD69E|nr:PaaI family thioesterase [Christensenella timonensis]
MDIERVKKFFEMDRFVKGLGIVIDSAGEGECVCSALIEDKHLNAGNVVQGGMIFTIADFTFAVAANCKHGNVVSLSNNITYNRPPKGKKLIASAKEISATRRTCLYEVEVCDELGTNVAYVTVTGFIKEGSIGL